MSSPLFSLLPHYRDAPRTALPAAHSTATPWPGTWPTRCGGPARISRIDEPLLEDTWRVRWQVPLDDAERPRGLLLGEGRLLVSGSERRGIFLLDGTPVATFKRQPGATFLDTAGKHYVVADAGGIATHSLEGAREALLPLSLATFATVREILLAPSTPGPAALVFVSEQKPPQARSLTLAECMRLVDYQRRQNGILYGVEPLAGVSRDGDHLVVAAASDAGPVLATSDGVCFFDWGLTARHEHSLATIPLAISVDAAGRALLVSDDYGELKFRIVPPHSTGPAREPLAELTLPEAYRGAMPPIVAPNGQIYLCSEQALMALTPTGQFLWQQRRSSVAPPIVTQNGLLLLADDQAHADAGADAKEQADSEANPQADTEANPQARDQVDDHPDDARNASRPNQLYAVVSDGTRVPLWRAPHPIRTEAILAGGIIYLATDSELFALEPAPTPVFAPTGSDERDLTGSDERDLTGSDQRDLTGSDQRDLTGSDNRDVTGADRRHPNGSDRRDPARGDRSDLARHATAAPSAAGESRFE